jgi:menaquinone-9 beta-reductase
MTAIRHPSAGQIADVLVVGGGPAGSATATFLAQNGIAVALIDKARFPRDKPCAEYLSPEASRLLHRMGVLDAVERAGAQQLSGMIVRAPGGEEIHGEFVARHGFRGFRDRGLALRRPILDSLLLDAARGAGVQVMDDPSQRVTDVLRDPRGTVMGVHTASGPLRARIVIGADGLRSVVARRTALTARARWPRRVALVTHFRGVRGMRSLGEMHVAVVVPTRAGHALAGQSSEFLESWVLKQPQLRDRFVGAERVTEVQTTGPFAVHARSATAAGVALVGDAADFFDPFTGEGIFAALRGAELLAPLVVESLAARTASDAARRLAQYDRVRRTAFAGKWRVERLISAAVAAPWLLDRAARVLSRRRDVADLLVGVAGDFVPPRAMLSPRVLWQLLSPPRS